MPRYNVWIRKEHDNLWQMIDNKSDWIGKKLEDDHKTESKIVRAHIVNEGVDLGILPETSRVADIPEWTEANPPRAVEQMACCNSRTPCKHWSFNGLTEMWENSLDGRTKAIA